MNASTNRTQIRTFTSQHKEKVCPTCLDSSVIVVDIHHGDEICNQCGQILQSRIISEEKEWRSFSNNDGNSASDRNRVAGKNDSWLDVTVGGTIISGTNKKFKNMQIAHDMATNLSKSDKKLKTLFHSLQSVAETIQIHNSTVERCREIIKELQKNEKFQVRPGLASILGLVYFAAKEDHNPMQLATLMASDSSLKERDILKSAQRVRKGLLSLTPAKTNSGNASSELASRAVSILKLSSFVASLSSKICYLVESLSIQTSARPQHIAAVAIFISCQLTNTHLTVLSLLNSTQCGITSFLNTYKQLFPHAKSIVPSDFVAQNLGGINSLVQPDDLERIDSI